MIYPRYLILLSIFIFLGCAPPPANDSTSTPSNEGSSKTSIDNSAFENVNLDNIIDNSEGAEDLEIDNIPKGEFTLEGLKKALDEIEVSKEAELTIYDDIQLIDNIDDYEHEPGKIKFTYVAIGKSGNTLEETQTITLVESETKDSENNNTEILIYGLFAGGTLKISDLKFKLKSLQVADGNFLDIGINGLSINDIDSFNYPLGNAILTLIAKDKDNQKNTKTIQVNLLNDDTTNETSITIYGVLASGEYEIDSLKNHLMAISASGNSTISLSLNGVPINSITSHSYPTGSALLNIKATHPDGTVKSETVNISIKEITGTPITIYGLFAPGEYEIDTLKNNLKGIVASDNATIALSLNGQTIYSIDSHSYSIGSAIIEIKATHPDGTVKSESINISIKETTITPPNGTQITIYGQFSWGDYTVDIIKSKLKGITASGGSQIALTLNGSVIQSIDSHNYSIGPANLQIKATHPDGTIKTKLISFNIEPNPVDISIFGLFPSGTYNKNELIAKINGLSASDGSIINVDVNGDRVIYFDSYPYPYSAATLTISAKHSSGSTKEVTIDVTITKPPLELRTTYRSTFLWNDAGSGADSDVSFYRPEADEGYLIFGDKIWGASSGSGWPILSVKAGHEDVRNPLGYTLIWDDRGSGANNFVAIWRPTAPIGFTCLGDVASLYWATQPDTSIIACVRDEHTENWSTIYKVWDDGGSGSNADFSGWERNVENDNYVDPTTFISNRSHGQPSIGLFKVLKKSSVKFNN